MKYISIVCFMAITLQFSLYTADEQQAQQSSGQSDKKEKVFDSLDKMPRDLWTICQGYVGHRALSLAIKRELKAHNRPIYSTAWHPAGDIFASGSRDRTVKIWDARSHKEVHTLQHEGDVASLDYDSKGERLLSADATGAVRLWNTQDYKQPLWKQDTEDGRSWYRAIFDRNGERVAVGADTTVALLDIETHKIISTGKTTGDIIDLLWLHKDPNMLILAEELTVSMFDIRTPKSTLLGAAFPFHGGQQVACSSDDTFMLWPDHDKLIVWDRKANEVRQRIETDSWVYSMQLSKDDESIVTTQKALPSLGKNFVSIWDRKTSKLQERMMPKDQIESAQWSPDERDLLVVVCSGSIHRYTQPELLASLAEKVKERD